MSDYFNFNNYIFSLNLNSLCLEHNVEDVREIIIIFKYLSKNVFFLFLQWKCYVLFKLYK